MLFALAELLVSNQQQQAKEKCVAYLSENMPNITLILQLTNSKLTWWLSETYAATHYVAQIWQVRIFLTWPASALRWSVGSDEHQASSLPPGENEIRTWRPGLTPAVRAGRTE